MSKELSKYVELARRSRELFSPQITAEESAEEYRVRLQESFTQIRELAEESEDILRREFYPLVSREGALTEEQIDALDDFFRQLLNATDMENMDLPILYLQAERLVMDAAEKKDIRTKCRALDAMVMASYAMMNLSLRLWPCYDVGFRYRDMGIAAAKRLIAHLEPEKFAALPDDVCKEAVLINTRYVSALYEWADIDYAPARVTEDLEEMRQALALASDPFYREQAPNYDWNYHIYRTLQYIACFPEYNNRRRFTKAQLKELAEYTRRFLDFQRDVMPEMEAECNAETQQLYLDRNIYLAGEISLAEYKSRLEDLMERLDKENYSPRSMFLNFNIPYEYILVLDPEHLSEKEKETLRTFYSGLTRFIYRSPKMSSLSFMLTFLADILRIYIDVPGAPQFEDLCMELMAALHPPTYIHTLCVADIMRCLTGHLLERRPDLFVGMFGIDRPEQAASKREEILDFAEHAALYHDLGKIFVIEAVLTYGRNLIDEEYNFISTHPGVGAYFLKMHPSTAPFAEIVRGHHRWYDNSAGYPHDFDMESAEDETIISLLSVADCLDASTDEIGRSYKQSRSLDEYIAEVLEESGTRYAPYVAALLTEAEIRRDLEKILEEKRDENYRKTYELLRAL